MGIPLCCLQALLAAPMFHLIFPDGKWDNALPLFETLSLAMGFAMPMSTAMSLLIAQGRLRLNMILTVTQALLFVSFVLTGAFCGSVEWVANFVALFYLIVGPLTIALPVVGSGVSPLRFLGRLYWFPVLTGLAVSDAGYVLSNQLNLHSNLLILLIRTAAWLAVTAILILVVRPPASRELAPRAAALLKLFLPKGRPA